MNANVTSGIQHRSQRGTARQHRLRGVALLGWVVGALVLFGVGVTHGLTPREASRERVGAEQAVEYPRRELPREWRWEPKAVPVEHMYSQKGSRRLDWIGRPGSRSY